METPHNLKVSYDDDGEVLLSFISSDNIDGLTLNINGTNYTMGQNEFSTYLYNEDLSNVYIVRLLSFAEYKGIEIDNSTLIEVSVKANTSNAYLKSSEFSNSISCQIISVLESPIVSVLSTTENIYKVKIGAKDSPFLSGFAIYLGNNKYKVVSKDTQEIELPLQEAKVGVRVQAISNNNNCYSSNLSNVIYPISNPSTNSIEINFDDSVVSWNNIATSYCIEITNSTFRYSQFVTETTFDLSAVCAPNKYNVKIIAIGEGEQIENETTIEYTSQLTSPTGVRIETKGDTTYLYFDTVANADGYLMCLNGTMVDKMFISSPINLNSYISSANSYNVQLQAINLTNNCVQGSALSGEQVIQSVRTLSSPLLTISKDGDKYYLKVDVDESEASMASSYEVWINYQSIGGEPFQDSLIDITSYFANAGQYNFMVKAKAIDSPYIKDSNMASYTYNCTKQLDTVTDIKVTKLEGESTYILTFKEQTLAAKYIYRIVKEGDDNFVVEKEASRGVVDISEHIVEQGVYRVYVQAIALEGSFYTDSATSGNPCRFTKGESLAVVENITVTKRTGAGNAGEIDLTWDSVENISGYQVYVYYNNQGENILKKSIFVSQTESPTLNIGSGEYMCLNKEGSYTIQIKALGDDKAYESSKAYTLTYIYLMENQVDFERNNISMYGNTYNYKVETVDELKNLLWYHYLYNEDVWNYNTLEYNLKIYCNADLDGLANDISESVATQVENVTANVAKMNIIAKALIEQYPEMDNISYGLKDSQGNTRQAFCLNEAAGIYIFRYVDTLDDIKTNSITTTTKVYGEKLDVIDTFDQRTSTYVFAIDKQESIDVTTTEQLFMALQYNKKPNFVGDCYNAKVVYENARFILRQICSDNMSEYEKTLQIYNFLIKSIALNENAMLSESTTQGNLKEFYLEGILYNDLDDSGLFASLDQFIGISADSEGLAKTFVALFGIEGIDAIKVNGKKQVSIDDTPTNVNYAWNKVYIDIEEDGHEGKRWYAIDLASAMNNSVTIDSKTYQLALHKYFLVQDTDLEIQATTWHKRLGATTDYVAETEFDYYSYQRFSCEYNSTNIVDNSNFNVSKEEDASISQAMTNALIYTALKAGTKNKAIVDVYAEDFIKGITSGSTDANSYQKVINEIQGNTIYGEATKAINRQFNLSVEIVEDKYIVLIVRPIG